MKILFDLIATQPSKSSKFHGGGEYAKSLFKALLKNKGSNTIEGVFDSTKELDNAILQLVQEHNIKLHDLKEHADLSSIINESGCNKYYTANPYHYSDLQLNNEIQYVYTIHGLRPIEMPTDFYEIKYLNSFRDLAIFTYKNVFRSRYIDQKKKQFQKIFSITQNRRIVVPSMHTKYSILNTFKEIKESEVDVFYSPFDKKNYDLNSRELEKFNVNEKKFFLLISANRWIKNNYRALKALDELFDENQELDYKVVTLGIKGNKGIPHLKNKDKFEFFGYVDESELELLNKYCKAFIYPTLNEGFGYPPLEVLKYDGCVLASCNTSISEVCGDSVLYFNPKDMNELKTRLLYAIHDEESLKKNQNRVNRYEYVYNEQKDMVNGLIELLTT